MGIYKSVPGAEVLGDSIQSTVEALGLYKDEGYKLLASLGIPALMKDEWYDQQLYCDFLGTLKEKVGNTTLLVAGRNIGKEAPLPPHLNTPAKVLASFQHVYRVAHRGVPADEGWKYISTGESSATMICTAPYPDDLSMGICDGFVRRFKTGAMFIKLDETKERIDKGGKSVTFNVQW